MDVRKTVIALVALLSISQEAPAVSALTAYWKKIKQWREAPTKQLTELMMDNVLENLNNATLQNNLQSFEQHKQRFLQLIEQNPDTLWYKGQWNLCAEESYIIDAAARFGLARNKQILDSMKHMYCTCLALSNKSILEPSPEESYLAHLVQDLIHNSIPFRERTFMLPDSRIRLELVLEYLANAHRHTMYTDANQDIPRDLNELITTGFIHGIPKRLQKNFREEAAQLEERRNTNEPNEFDLFLRFFNASASQLKESVLDKPHLPDSTEDSIYRLFRLFSHASLARKSLAVRVQHTIWRLTPSRLIALASATDAAGFVALQKHYPGAGIGTYVLLGGLSGALVGSLLSLLLSEERRARQEELPPRQWKKIAQGVNGSRLAFEADIDELPDVISMPSVAQENGFELE